MKRAAPVLGVVLVAVLGIVCSPGQLFFLTALKNGQNFGT
jgi:hypothetical protein